MSDFSVPTFGIANTRPEDMREEDFQEWLECIPEDKRQEWIERRENIIWHSEPQPGAVLIDLRFCAFKLELFERIENPNKRGEMITGEKYAETTITGAENPKPKKNKNKQILFALPIINL